MKVAGFTFIRNAIKNDYPIVEAITSILPICDEFIVALGQSEDQTQQLISNISSSKIRIIPTVWDASLCRGGVVFAAETDKAFKAITPDADWAFYIQGDECVHEQYLPLIKKEMEDSLDNPSIEGLLFRYLHFYGSYHYYGHSRRWYRREIRVVRNNASIHAYRDAQGFRWNKRKMKVKLIDAYIYHYGHVKPLDRLNHKRRNFNSFYQDKQETVSKILDDYEHADRLLPFKGSHPRVMHQRIAAVNWEFNPATEKLEKRMSLRRKILQQIEDWTHWRIGEYKNYTIVK